MLAPLVFPADRRATRAPPSDLGLADPVPAQRHRCPGGLHHPAPARGDADLQSEEVAHGEAPKTPLSYLFKYHWRGVLRVMFAAFIAMINTLYTVFALTFATSSDLRKRRLSSTFMLWIAIVANVIAIGIIPFWAGLSDKVGRKHIFVTGAVGSAILAVAYLAAIASKNGSWCGPSGYFWPASSTA